LQDLSTQGSEGSVQAAWSDGHEGGTRARWPDSHSVPSSISFDSIPEPTQWMDDELAFLDHELD